jgi:hypothetical protein
VRTGFGAMGCTTRATHQRRLVVYSRSASHMSAELPYFQVDHQLCPNAAKPHGRYYDTVSSISITTAWQIAAAVHRQRRLRRFVVA